jgi:aquaporin Z
MKKFLAESIGTFIFIFLTVGIDVIAPKGAGLLGIGASFGITYTALYYSINKFSVCHLNALLSIGALVKNEQTFKDTLFYILSQLIGGFIAVNAVFFILKGLPKPYDFNNYGFAQNGWGTNYVDEYNLTSAFLTELVGSFILALVYFTSTKSLKGLTVGLTLILLHWFGLYVTGASYNPIYSFCTAFIVNDFSQLWLFIIAPITGGVIAVFISNYLILNDNGKVL